MNKDKKNLRFINICMTCNTNHADVCHKVLYTSIDNEGAMGRERGRLFPSLGPMHVRKGIISIP